jgi:hypothetical protein
MFSDDATGGEFSFWLFYVKKKLLSKEKREQTETRERQKESRARRGLLSSFTLFTSALFYKTSLSSPFPELTHTHPCGHPSGNKRRRRTEAHHVLALR